LDRNGYVDFKEFVAFFQSLLRREEAEALFRKYSHSGFMDDYNLMKFLCTEQKETEVTLEECGAFLMRMGRSFDSAQLRLETATLTGSPTSPTSPKESLQQTFYMNEYLFSRYLFSDLNSMVNKSKKVTYLLNKAVLLRTWDGRRINLRSFTSIPTPPGSCGCSLYSLTHAFKKTALERIFLILIVHLNVYYVIQ
jgi:hypothetical protein